MSFPTEPGFYLYTPDAATTTEIQVYVDKTGLVYDAYLKPLEGDLPGTWRPFPLPWGRIVAGFTLGLGALGWLVWWMLP